MSKLLGVRHILRNIFARRVLDDETREELAFHVEQQTRKHIAAGMTPHDAARLASIELGVTSRIREETAEARRGRVLHDFIADVRYAMRGLVARPGFSASALATLGLGIGAAAAIASVVDGVLRKPLPFADVDRIMSISLRMPLQASNTVVDMVWSYPKYEALREQQTVYAAMALHSAETLVVTTNEGAVRVPGEMAGPSYFDILGVSPLHGRFYTPEEDSPGGASRVVVIGHAWWRDHYGSNPDALGQVIAINGEPHRIVGVLPPGFTGLSGDAELWIPVTSARSAAVLRIPDSHNMRLVGKLRDGREPAEAVAQLAVIGKRIDEQYPDAGHWGATAYPLASLRVNNTIRNSLQLLGMAVVLLLAIVCVNLTTLLVTRGSSRRKEFAVRLALGGSRGRLVRQLVTESVVLSVAGSVIGTGLAMLAVPVLTSTLPVAMPATGSSTDLTRLTFSAASINARVIPFAFAISLLLGAFIGIASAYRLASQSLFNTLRIGTATLAVSSQRGAARALASSGLSMMQVALAVLFLVASGLTIQSFRRTLSIPLGYQPEGLFYTRITLDPVRVTSGSVPVLWNAIVQEVSAISGVSNVALGSCAPIGMRCDHSTITLAGQTTAADVTYIRVSPEYFEAIGTPVMAGRTFEAHEIARRDAAIIVNRAAARSIWGAANPLATPVQVDTVRIPVVGVVDDARYEDVEQPSQPTVFVPFTSARGVLFIRSEGDPVGIRAAVKAAVRRAGSGHAMGEVQLMTERLHIATARNRLTAQIFSAFAFSALVLAAVGVYGTLSLRVSLRQREFAIRRALGATAASVARIVLSQASLIAVVGGVVGIALGAVISRLMTSLLYDVKPLEMSVYVVSGIVLTTVLVAATGIPVWRSARVDPREAMRAE